MKPYSPMLATTGEGPFNSVEYLFEVKWDGYRVIAYVDKEVVLRGRAADLTPHFRSITSEIRQAFPSPVVIDGEVVALDDAGRPSFHLLRKSSGQLRYMAFDILWLDGRECIKLTLDERRQRLTEVIRPNAVTRLSEATPTHGRDLYSAIAALNLEGMMAKRRASTYHPGQRSAEWLKILVQHSGLFDVVGYFQGPGHAITALELSEHGDPRGRCTAPAERWLTPLKTRPLRYLRPDGCHIIDEGLRCHVRYRELTPNGMIRHGVFLGFESHA